MLFQAALVALSASLAAAVTPLEVRGNAFVNPKTGNRFQIVGAAYQPGGSAGYDPASGSDPLSHGDRCMRDAALLQSIGVNAVRVYNLDPNINHDECASIFNAAGIYMMLDVNSPLVGESLTTDKPWESYYMEYLNRTFAIVEAFKSYPNTLLFFSGNEVISQIDSAKFVPQYLRAVTRDIKNYVKNHCDRNIPVGYSAADVRDVLVVTWNYMQCAENGDANDMSRVDLFALNSYSWCGDSNFKLSTYDQLVSSLESTSVPVFFSEYGCNEVTPRLFTEVGAIYGPDMRDVFSGSVVYEYTQEPNNYGLVKIAKDDSLTLLADFKTIGKQFAKLDVSTLAGGKPSSSSPKPPKCDSSLIKQAGFNSNFTLPAVPPGAQDIIDKGVSPKPSGKLIPISDYTVKFKVYDVDGKTEITNLAVKPLASDASNLPGGNIPGGSGTGTSTAPSPTETKKDAGASLRPALVLAMGLPLAALFFL